MIKKLTVKNFRCFKSLELDNLKRVNIVVGKNAGGKTALLESIKLGLDAFPGFVLWNYQLRNLALAFPSPPTPEQFRSVFIDFFYLCNTQEAIEIFIEDSMRREASLRISFDPSRSITIQTPTVGFLPQMAPIAPPTTIIPLSFERKSFERETDTLLASLNPQGALDFQPGKNMGIVSGMISSSYFGGPGESAAWLSQLNIEKVSDKLIRELLKLFPLISKIAPEQPTPGLGTIYADVQSFPRMIPLSLISGGASRLFLMMLAIPQFRKGVVLIDEIENGIHYKRYSDIWKILVNLAKLYETQLFVSSHSKECLKEAIPVIKENPDDFCLLKARLKENQSLIDESFGGEEIVAALEKNGEIRG